MPPFESRKVSQMLGVRKLEGNSVNLCTIHAAGTSGGEHGENEQYIVPGIQM